MSSDRYYPTKGQPTRPDVDRLLQRWPLDDMQVEDIFHDAEIAEVLGFSRRQRQRRYDTVLSAFKHHIFESTGLVLKRQRGEDLLVILAPEGVVEKVSKSVTSMQRATHRNSREIAATVPRTQEESEMLMRSSWGLARLGEALSQARRKFFAVDPPEPLPRPEKDSD